MSGAVLVLRWYCRAARILLRRVRWRVQKARRARQLRAPSFGAIAAPPRKIKPFVDRDHPCPRCDFRSYYLAATLKSDQWVGSCRNCQFKFAVPVEYRDAEPQPDHGGTMVASHQ